MNVHDPEYESRVRTSFAKQRFMSTIGATMATVHPGEVVIDLPFADALVQQHGYLHAGVVSSVVDSACGYAALTLMRPGMEVLSIEFKINLLAPAQGQRFHATGRVVRSGRTITVCNGEMKVAESGTVVALMQATMMAVEARSW